LGKEALGKMSKFLFMSNTGDGLGLALHLKGKGHQVAAWLRDKRAKRNYDGLLEKPRRWESFLTKETIVVYDSSGGGRTGDRLRASGYSVFMGSVFADALELERDVAFEYMQQVGIKVPHSETFHDWEDGRVYAKKEGGRLAFKPSGKLADDQAVGSYVGSDEDDLVEMLHYFESVATHPPDYELQEFIDGVAISTEGWFNGERFMVPFNHTVERKQTMNGNLGPSGGCAGNLVWAWQTGTNHIIEEGIKLMGPVLAEFGYVGPIDLNSIVNEQGVWALEFTPRFGYDALPSFLELFQGDIGDDLIAPLARGDKPKEFVMKGGLGSALRVNVPPYPSDQFHHEGNVPIRGLERKDRDHLFFYDVMFNERNQLVTSPAYGAVVAITGHGFDSEEAFAGPMAIAKKAKIPEKMYRTDLAVSLDNDIARFNRLVQIRRNTNDPG
jgi:phosphoribosylamine---glycine ligase